MTRPLLPRRPSERPFVLGHRGARAHAPENTMRAFERALSDGADGIEIDVRMTSDGALRIAHDEELKFQGVPTPLKLGKLSTGQLAELTPESGQPLPRLMDVLRFQAETGCLVNVELKPKVANPSWMCERAAAEIRAHGGSGIVTSSFSPLMVRQMALLLPEIPCALLFDKHQKWTRRLLPMDRLGAVGAHPQSECTDPTLVRRIKERECFVGVWTVNEPKRAVELAKMGVDVLIGDDPGALIRQLEG